VFQGSVSQNTKLMLKTGLTKFIPMKSFDASQETNDSDERSLATTLNSCTDLFCKLFVNGGEKNKS